MLKIIISVSIVCLLGWARVVADWGGCFLGRCGTEHSISQSLAQVNKLLHLLAPSTAHSLDYKANSGREEDAKGQSLKDFISLRRVPAHLRGDGYYIVLVRPLMHSATYVLLCKVL